VVTTTQQLAEEVMSITGGAGAYAVVDSIGGDIASDLAAAVRPGGTIHIYGLLGGVDVKANGMALVFRDVRYHGFWLVSWMAGKTPEDKERVKATTLDLMAKGIMKPETGGWEVGGSGTTSRGPKKGRGQAMHVNNQCKGVKCRQEGGCGKVI
jgi:NADPH:quinone reductase-like Zn-dependent oxidoreductase